MTKEKDYIAADAVRYLFKVSAEFKPIMLKFVLYIIEHDFVNHDNPALYKPIHRLSNQ